MLERLRKFLNVFDERFEDLTPANWKKVLYADASAGLIVALTAIPMSMGFAMASGLRPEQGIVAGAIACLVGRTFGGSKYQVYGPTAAFIPLLAAIMARYDHGFLVLVSLISGVILALFGLLGLGRFARLIPNSVVVGFTIGIAVSIAFTNLGDALGLEQAVRGALWDRLRIIFESLGEINGFAIGIFAASLLANRALPKISPFLPTPLLTIVLGTAAATLLGELGQPLPLVRDRFGSIPADLFRWTPPSLPYFSSAVIFDGLYFVTAIVFISGVESLLCSSMADRLAENKRTPFDPDKEFWGQGLVQIITPLANGFPCTGALARTATSIRAGAITPLAGYAKGLFKILLAMASARFLEQIPLAGIAAVLFWVASNMIKADEVKAVRRTGKRSSVVMWVTAVLVPITDFLTGVCGGLVLHAALVAFNKKERK